MGVIWTPRYLQQYIHNVRLLLTYEPYTLPYRIEPGDPINCAEVGLSVDVHARVVPRRALDAFFVLTVSCGFTDGFSDGVGCDASRWLLATFREGFRAAFLPLGGRWPGLSRPWRGYGWPHQLTRQKSDCIWCHLILKCLSDSQSVRELMQQCLSDRSDSQTIYAIVPFRQSDSQTISVSAAVSAVRQSDN